MKEFHLKLPQNKKEFFLFLLIVSIISVNIIAPLIVMLRIGFSLENYKQVLGMLPKMWIAVVITVLLAKGPAQALKKLIVNEKDSFNAQITINIMCNVLVVSAIMTILSSWIVASHITMMPAFIYFNNWPRNFAIALIVELLIAQPIARQVIFYHHLRSANV